MALQLGALRDALIDAGASPEKAAKAAEELAAYENRLRRQDLRVREVRRIDRGRRLIARSDCRGLLESLALERIDGPRNDGSRCVEPARVSFQSTIEVLPDINGRHPSPLRLY
jgi:hypothetical protein